MIPTSADRLEALDLFHFLMWRIRCLEASGNAFQRLFENAMQRLEPETFRKVRSYGNVGDRKTDGLLYGVGTAYQVYAPNLMRLAAVNQKIRDDLAGCVAFWREELQKWVFVYNESRGWAGGGIAADIFHMLGEEQKGYENVSLEALSDDALWERVRELEPGKRHEFLGALPEGWVDIFVPPPDVPDDRIEGLGDTRIVIIHDNLGPADRYGVLTALRPERPFGLPLRLAPSVSDLGWLGAAEYQEKQVRDIVDRAAEHLSRFAVFPLSEIPLLVHLGFVLSDTKDVQLYQFHRDRESWAWDPDEASEADVSIEVAGLPAETIEDEVEVAIRISLSAEIGAELTAETVAALPVEIDLFVQSPNRDWLRSREQINSVRRCFRRIVDELIRKVPRCSRIHLFIAAPAPVAVAVGQAINPRMTPTVQLYEYDLHQSPKYEPVLQLVLA